MDTEYQLMESVRLKRYPNAVSNPLRTLRWQSLRLILSIVRFWTLLMQLKLMMLFGQVFVPLLLFSVLSISGISTASIRLDRGIPNPSRTSLSNSTLAAAPNIADGRANATFVMLARNSEIWKAIESVKAVEDRFNKQYKYPWVFLNDEPFTEEFIK